MKRTSWLTASIGLNLVLGAALSGWTVVEFNTYRNAHAVLIQTPCHSEMLVCDAFQYDLFGDGTVVYQHADTKAPAITYMINPLTAAWALWQLDNPQYHWTALAGAGGMHSGNCVVLSYQFGKTRENGCGHPDLKQANPMPPALKPLIKAVRLDVNKPDYAPTLPSGVVARPYVASKAHKVDPIYWAPSPAP